MTTRIVTLMSVAIGSGLAWADTIHRNGFAGREPFWFQLDANIPFELQSHRISDEHYKNAPTAEYIKIKADPPPGAADLEYVHFAYTVPPAPVSDRLKLTLWVKAYRDGVQLKARLVLPKEKDPTNPDIPLTTILIGETYRTVRQWQPLSLGNVAELVRRQRPMLLARLGREVDTTGAYIDRVIVNVYAGRGITEVWLDDLEVGPVRPDLAPPPVGPPAGTRGAILTKQTKSTPSDLPPGPTVRPRIVGFSGSQITVDGDPFFMLAIRHSDTPLKTLADAQFNTVWFPSEVSPEALEEAVRHNFWIVPRVPFEDMPTSSDGRTPTGFASRTPDADAESIQADVLAKSLRRFSSGDGVLMWDLGNGRSADPAQVRQVGRVADALAVYDPGRPRAINVWDGFGAYSPYAEAIGVHRWPLFTSLELGAYKEWLAQRRLLTPLGAMPWTWVQTHLPDWYVTLLAGRANVDHFDDPVGPHPEQIRVLTYLSLAAGCKGLGFWSDRFLANSHHGRDRLLELALLNVEIDMIKPLLFTAGPAHWIGTSHPHVLAAVFRTENPRETTEILVLPVWLGPGTQHCPPHGVIPKLTLKVANVPDGAIPWLISPAGVTEITNVRRVAGGTEIDLMEFDLTATVVFTTDIGLHGKIVRWQDHTRYRIGQLAAVWAHQQAIEQYNKTLAVHKRIYEAGGPYLEFADDHFERSRLYVDKAREFLDNRQYDAAYREARRALRPLRSLMRALGQGHCVSGLSDGQSLRGELFFASAALGLGEAGAIEPSGGTAFSHGQFELSQAAPAEGAAVMSLPGWSVRKSLLDRGLIATAAIINSDKLADDKPPPPAHVPVRTNADRVGYRPEEAYRKPPPDLGRHSLKLSIQAPILKDPKGKTLPPPAALERAFLAVDSEIAELAPGQLARISFWVKVPAPIAGSADGFLAFDSVGGEPLGVRIGVTGGWREFHLYRRLPADGRLSMTFALTGIGTAYVDNVRVEPLLPSGGTPGTPVDPQPLVGQPVARRLQDN